MRLCRYDENDQVKVGYFYDGGIVPVDVAARAHGERIHADSILDTSAGLLDLLPSGKQFDRARQIAAWLDAEPRIREQLSIPASQVRLLAPVPKPTTIILLAGNYAAHIEEGGQIAVERSQTFPYLFMKPQSAVNHPGAPIPIPRVSPDHIDYECELGVVIGKTAKHLTEANALEHVAGYTVINDVSDREYKPFPDRKLREKDDFFDWLHGKWHDGFLPMGPCVTSANTIPDPQQLKLELRVNGEVRQSASTGQMIFPVAAILEFITRTVTLHPGDVIATGTPAGVGATTRRFLKPGDVVDATIERIGTLTNTLAPEAG